MMDTSRLETMTRSTRSLMVFCGIFYLAAVALLYVGVVRRTGGHFTYALDDPYIHLALAENLAHGHYGINPTEFTSPSSSIVWPFLLAPFAGTRFFGFVPLFWNLIFGVIAAVLIGYSIARYPPQQDERGFMPWWQQAVTAVLLLFAANLAGLTMLGMEHVLQVMLAVCCAIGLIEALSGRPIPRWCLPAAIVAPMVRFEDLAVTLAVCIALAGFRRWKAAFAVFGLSLVPLIAFSVFLKSKGLPLLPLSVLVKGHAATTTNPVRAMVNEIVRYGLYLDVRNSDHYPVVIFFLIFAGLAWRTPQRERRAVFAGAAVLAGLQLTIGHFNWFHRYEVYALIVLALLCMRVLAERPKFMFGFFALGLLFCATPYIDGTAVTTAGALRVYEQQFQMHRFVTEFYHGDYAVNDLGWVSYQRRPGVYVLDIYGLASLEAWRQPNKTAAWMENIVREHGIKLAMVYPNPEWNHIPTSWNGMGEMCLSLPDPGFLGERCVVFYSTTPHEDSALRLQLAEFAKTLPPGVTFTLGGYHPEETKWVGSRNER